MSGVHDDVGETLFVERSSIEEAVGVLRGILDQVTAGGLDPDGPNGRSLIRRLEGAVAALEAILEAPDPDNSLT